MIPVPTVIVWMGEETSSIAVYEDAPDCCDPGFLYAFLQLQDLCLSERRIIMKTTSTTATVRSGRAATRMIVCVGMLAAISTILMLFEFPLPFLAPGFYELDFSEVPILIGAFALGPVAGVLTELVKVLLNLVINGTQTAFVGEFANFVMGCMFVLPASLIYKMKKSRKHAVIGLAAGTVIMSVAAVFINALVLLPAYAKAFGMPIDAFVEMGSAINPAINSLWTFVVLAVAPFNLIKGVLVSVITVLLYKHISPILKGNL